MLELDGIISYKFSKKGSIYWLRNVYYVSEDKRIMARIKPDFYTLKSIDKLCSNVSLSHMIDEFEIEDFRRQALYYSPNYKDQSIRGDNPIHYGGDTYSLYDSTLIIAFKIKGQGVLFNELCEQYLTSQNFTNESIIPCEYREDKIQTPVIVLVKYDTTFSLSRNDISNLQLSTFEPDSFNIMWCE
jgi:hypothetical protein